MNHPPPHPAQSGEPPTPLQRRVQRNEAELGQLNVRIARLALSLNVTLDTANDLQRLLNHEPALFAPLNTGSTASSAQSRQRHELEELRGLLVMRCELMSRMLEELGLDMTFQISAEVEDWLQRQGFKPGADGFALLRSMQAAKLSGTGDAETPD